MPKSVPQSPDSSPEPRRDPFTEVVLACAAIPEFRQEYNRLTGDHFGEPQSAINALIDQATGYDKDQMARFCAFVFEFVYLRLDPIAASSSTTESGGE